MRYQFVTSVLAGMCLGTLLCFIPPRIGYSANSKDPVEYRKDLSDLSPTIFILKDKATEYVLSREFTSEEKYLLKQNAYFEAREGSLNENSKDAAVEEMENVTFAVVNRIINKDFPKTITGVITQGYKVGSKICNFSWYCDGVSDDPDDQLAWEVANHAVENVLNGMANNRIGDSTYYHAKWIEKPKSWKNQEVVYDNPLNPNGHVFYNTKPIKMASIKPKKSSKKYASNKNMYKSSHKNKILASR